MDTLSASAFRGVASELVRHAVVVDLRAFGIESTDVSRDEADDPGHDVAFFYGDRWTLARWPQGFATHDVPIAQRLSTALGCTVSTIHRFADEYWSHYLVQEGRVVDRFCSRPGYFGPDGSDPAMWAGDAELLATAAGGDAGTIRPYLVHLPMPERGWRARFRRGGGPRHGKANPDDRFELDEASVFADFWRRLGVHYPGDADRPVRRVRLASGWEERLPQVQAP